VRERVQILADIHKDKRKQTKEE